MTKEFDLDEAMDVLEEKEAALRRLQGVPTISEVVKDPHLADGLSNRVLMVLLEDLLMVVHHLHYRMLANPPADGALAPEMNLAADIVSIEGAAEILQVHPETMRKWLRRKPYIDAVVHRTRTKVLVSKEKLREIFNDRGKTRLFGGRRKAEL